MPRYINGSENFHIFTFGDFGPVKSPKTVGTQGFSHLTLLMSYGVDWYT